MKLGGVDNIPSTKDLIDQVRQKTEERLSALQAFMPTAKLEFGTELVKNNEGNIVALLGASPGASTAVAICWIF